MYVFDTNVVSEMMKASVASSVRAWVSAVPRDKLFTTAITSAEIFAGIARLPAGRRRDGLQSSAETVFRQSFAGRVLPFDEARAFASVTAGRRAVGRPIDEFDGQIAAISLVARFALVTRNVSDFEQCGLVVVDPWTA